MISVVIITKNEAKTLPRLIASLRDFQKRGEIIVVDTGSEDGTQQIAHDLNCRLFEKSFTHTIDRSLADAINNSFPFDEPDIVKEGDTYFDFASARNYAASLASHDMICSVDADEVVSANWDKIESFIREGVTQFEYNFIFAHDAQGNPAIAFTQSKFYDRRKLKWTGIVHEVLTGEGKAKYLTEDIFKIDHWQNHESGRHTYLKGLAVDCAQNPNNDRNSHYFARELYWSGRPQSAIKEFTRHIDMNGWDAERGQSFIFMGDCYGALNSPDLQASSYFSAFHIDSTRREGMIKLAKFYLHNKNYQAAICYATGALEIPFTPFYANHISHYTWEPHQILYTAYGWAGQIEKAKYHFKIAAQFNPEVLREVQYYFKLPTISIILPTLGREEGLKKCLHSIEGINYPKELIEIKVIYGPETVPQKVNRGYKETSGQWIVFAANDMTFHPDCLIQAVIRTGENKIVSFNEGPLLQDQGNICTHFMIHRSKADELGEIFSEKFHHVGVDNLLWAKCKGERMWCEFARITHNHFSKGAILDEVYMKGWERMDQDRELLKKELELI